MHLGLEAAKSLLQLGYLHELDVTPEARETLDRIAREVQEAEEATKLARIRIDQGYLVRKGGEGWYRIDEVYSYNQKLEGIIFVGQRKNRTLMLTICRDKAVPGVNPEWLIAENN